MRELKCPKCGNVFTVDEADYAAILSQVKNKEFDQEVSRRLEELHRLVLGERFGCHVEQFGLSAFQVFLHLKQFGFRQRRVHHVGNAEFGAEVANHIHLVLHQRDERRYDDGRAFRHQCGQLVAERLASSRGHQYESVVAVKDAFDDFFLVAFELVETENILQQLVDFLVIFFCHRFLLLVLSKFLRYFAICFEI